jgi:predicted neutral ceramidase superfamily lipid hydrolase
MNHPKIQIMKKKNKTSLFLRITTLVCALGMFVVKMLQHAPFDGYILPALFLFLSIGLFAVGSDKERTVKKLSIPQSRILISVLAVFLAGGLLTAILV